MIQTTQTQGIVPYVTPKPITTEERVALLEAQVQQLSKAQAAVPQPPPPPPAPPPAPPANPNPQSSNPKKICSPFCSRVGFVLVSKVHVGFLLLRRRPAVVLSLTALFLQLVFVVGLSVYQERWTCQVVSAVIDSDEDDYRFLYRNPRNIHVCSTKVQSKDMMRDGVWTGCEKWIGCTLEGLTQQDYEVARGECERDDDNTMRFKDANGCHTICCKAGPLMNDDYGGNNDYDGSDDNNGNNNDDKDGCINEDGEKGTDYFIEDFPEEYWRVDFNISDYETGVKCDEDHNDHNEIRCNGLVSITYIVCPEIVTVVGASLGYLALVEALIIGLVLLCYMPFAGKSVWGSFEEAMKYWEKQVLDEEDPKNQSPPSSSPPTASPTTPPTVPPIAPLAAPPTTPPTTLPASPPTTTTTSTTTNALP